MSLWVYQYLVALFFWCVCAFLCVCVTEGDPHVSGALCPVHLPGQTPLTVSSITWLCQLDGVGPDEGFLPLTPAWTGMLCNRLGDRFSKQAGHEYASSFHKQPGKKKKLDLDLAESENKQFCRIQAAALTLSAFSPRPSLSLQFYFSNMS